VKSGLTTAPVDERLSTASADAAGSFRWDSSDRQYIYNWGTAKGDQGVYRRIGVTLDDGETYYVYVALR
jgi:hypothetical protein